MGNDLKQLMTRLVRTMKDYDMVSLETPSLLAKDIIDDERWRVRVHLVVTIIVMILSVAAMVTILIKGFQIGMVRFATTSLGNTIPKAEFGFVTVVVFGVFVTFFTSLTYNCIAKLKFLDKTDTFSKLAKQLKVYDTECLENNQCLESASEKMHVVYTKLPQAKKLELEGKQRKRKEYDLTRTACVVTDGDNIGIQQIPGYKPLRYERIQDVVSTFEDALAHCMHVNSEFVACVQMKDGYFYKVFPSEDQWKNDAIDNTKSKMVVLLTKDDNCVRLAIRADATVVIPMYGSNTAACADSIQNVLAAQTRLVRPYELPSTNAYDPVFVTYLLKQSTMNATMRDPDTSTYTFYPGLDPSSVGIASARNAILSCLLTSSSSTKTLNACIFINGADLNQTGLKFSTASDTYRTVWKALAGAISRTYAYGSIPSKIQGASMELNGILGDAATQTARVQYFADYQRAIYKLDAADRALITSNVQSATRDMLGYFRNTRIDDIERILIDRETMTRNMLCFFSLSAVGSIVVYVMALNPDTLFSSTRAITCIGCGIVLTLVAFLSWNESHRTKSKNVMMRNTEQLFANMTSVKTIKDFFQDSEAYKRLTDVMDKFGNTSNLLNPDGVGGKVKNNALTKTFRGITKAWRGIQSTKVLVVICILCVFALSMSMFVSPSTQSTEDASPTPQSNTPPRE